MELTQFLSYMDRQQANQAILPSDAPPRLLVGGTWESASASTSSTTIEMMLRGAMPVTLRPRLDEVKGKFHFNYTVSGGTFRVQVESERGERQISITRLDADGQPLVPLPNLAPAGAPSGTSGKDNFSVAAERRENRFRFAFFAYSHKWAQRK